MPATPPLNTTATDQYSASRVSKVRAQTSENGSIAAAVSKPDAGPCERLAMITASGPARGKYAGGSVETTVAPAIARLTTASPSAMAKPPLTPAATPSATPSIPPASAAIPAHCSQ